VVLIYY